MQKAPATRSVWDYVALVRRRRFWVLIPTLLFTMVGIWYSSRTPLVYTSTAVVQVGSPGAPSSARANNNEKRVIESSEVRAIVQRTIPAPAGYFASVSDFNDFITITATSAVPDVATETAQAVADAYITYKRDRVAEAASFNRQTLARQLDQLRTEVTALDGRIRRETDPVLRASYDQERAALYGTVVSLTADLARVRISGQLIDPGVRVSDAATIPSAPSGPGRRLYGSVGVILGLIVGFAAASLRDVADSRVKVVADLERHGWSPVLAVLPEERAWATRRRIPLIDTKPSGRTVEAFRNLRTSLRLLVEKGEMRTMLVTSTTASEGKSTIAANLALSLAAAGTRILLVDADLRRPAMATSFGIDEGIGLSDVLLGTADLESCAVSVPGFPNLSLITAGSREDAPAELLASRWNRDFTKALAEMAEIVLIDGPPALMAAETQQLSSLVDGIVFVVGSKRNTSNQIAEAVRLLRRANATILGFALNRSKGAGSQSSREGYGYGYGSGSGHRPGSKLRELRAGS